MLPKLKCRQKAWFIGEPTVQLEFKFFQSRLVCLSSFLSQDAIFNLYRHARN